MKRCIDITLAFLFIIFFSPFFLLLPLLIKLESKGAIIFKQKRVGKNEKLFHIYKFRSMQVNQIDPFEYDLIKNDLPLETRVGGFMRRTKLDEIPQFFNVLRGDMSLVGPRPCLEEHTKNLTQRERERFSCRPGMTGWAEIHGLDMDNWHQRLILDLWYVDNQSLKLDFLIMLKTSIVIFVGK
jgi:lipopolysaccharide/colanic/teichoic acid biosynthesis glycosyltransferase